MVIFVVKLGRFWYKIFFIVDVVLLEHRQFTKSKRFLYPILIRTTESGH